MLPDDGPNGPKHVGAIQRDILSVSCSISCFNKECICWQKSFELIKMHGKTTTKITEQSFIIKPGTLSRPTDLGRRRCSTAVQTPETRTEEEDEK
jgi:hypothetical protein